VRNHKPAVGGSNPTVVAFFLLSAQERQRWPPCIFSAACSSPRTNLASHSLPRSNLLFRVTLLSPISCVLPHCRNPAARNNFFSSHLIYLRTTHYFIHLNSSNTFVILLPSSHLALAFCSFISLLCCNHATRNNFYSNRLIHFRTIHSLYPQQEPPRGLSGLVNAIGSLPMQCRR
jgi:hypothetical protein